MLLVDEFLRKTHRTATNVTSKFPDPLVKSMDAVIHQAVQTGEKVYFAPSTMKMLVDKLAHFQETARKLTSQLNIQDIESIYERSARFTAGWIEFDKPITVNTPIAAFLCFQPTQYERTGRDGYQLYLIDQFAQVAEVFERKSARDNWRFSYPFHRCTRCQYEHGIITPCPACQNTLDVWVKIVSLSFIIAGQYLAMMRYEEKAFTGIRRVKREHSNKERRIPVKHIFKVIDANEIIIQVPPQGKAEQPHEIRGSWMVDGEIVYEEICTRPFQRTYRHERYKASGLQGTTVKFPEGITRMQPRKKENIGKHVTKVKASHYEDRPIIDEKEG